jgi:PAS domain S-box-containing protein
MNDSLEVRLQATLNVIPAYTWYAAQSGALTFVNERTANYLGLPADHPLRFGIDTGAAWDSHIPLLHPDDQDEARRVWSNCLETGSAGQLTFRVRNAQGSYRWFISCAEPLRASDGELRYWIGTNVDIEERKQDEVTKQDELTRDLRGREAELRQILDLAPQLTAVLGPERERLFVNRTTLEYFGITLDEWRRHGTRPHVYPDNLGLFAAEADLSQSTASASEYELQLRRNDGHYRWFLMRQNPLRDEQGRVLRWYVACTDIDDRKRAEERLQQENVALREEIDKTSMFEEIIGTSPALTAVLSRVSKVAGSDSTVLITGETGTGKELVARAIHRRSKRSSKAFVAVNCAAIPRELIASELFGHEKGAFTGALQRRLGRFELAHGGTIFLDEVAELSPDMQAALLRVLQERELEHVGGTETIHVDVRVIAATNRDLIDAVASGIFRQDLFYRLNVFPLEMPSLRDRKQDIPVLVEYFTHRYARKAHKTFRRINKKTLDRLQSYPWPGNVRELQNVIERSVIVCDSDEFTVDESWLSTARKVGGGGAMSRKMSAYQKAIIEEALRASGGQVFGPAGAAARLRISRSTLESRIRVLRINKNRFRPRPTKDHR